MRRVRLCATTLHVLPQPYPATAWRRGCREVHLPLIRVDEPAAELPGRSATLSQTACAVHVVEQPVAVLERGEGETRYLLIPSFATKGRI